MEVKLDTKTINPYWDDARKLSGIPDVPGNDEPGAQAWLDRILFVASRFARRDDLVRTYAWAIADPVSVAFVVWHVGPRVVEIGAGNGYWAWLLSQCGVDIVAYDNKPPDQDINVFFCPRNEVDYSLVKKTMKTWFPVQRGDVEVLRNHADRTLFLC